MSQKGKRTATEQARTARFLLAQMITQIAEYEEHMAKPRSVRRMEIRLGMFDSTIIDRIGQLREQRTKWEARLAELVPLEKAEQEAAERVEHDKRAERAAERERACSGAASCAAGAHYHGCYADTDGSTCDEPQAHPVNRARVEPTEADLDEWREAAEHLIPGSPAPGRLVHALTDGRSRCGATGSYASVFWPHVTCPECLATKEG